jgi:hypothetical protein
MVLEEFIQKKKNKGSQGNQDEDIQIGDGIKRLGSTWLRALLDESDLLDYEQGRVGRDWSDYWDNERVRFGAGASEGAFTGLDIYFE